MGTFLLQVPSPRTSAPPSARSSSRRARLWPARRTHTRRPWLSRFIWHGSARCFQAARAAPLWRRRLSLALATRSLPCRPRVGCCRPPSRRRSDLSPRNGLGTEGSPAEPSYSMPAASGSRRPRRRRWTLSSGCCSSSATRRCTARATSARLRRTPLCPTIPTSALWWVSSWASSCRISLSSWSSGRPACI